VNGDDIDIRFDENCTMTHVIASEDPATTIHLLLESENLSMDMKYLRQ
jgi:hypothetical protein